MTFHTILIITALSGPLDGHRSYLLFPSLERCEAATRAVSEVLAYDHSLACVETLTASASIRPVRNPRYAND